MHESTSGGAASQASRSDVPSVCSQVVSECGATNATHLPLPVLAAITANTPNGTTGATGYVQSTEPDYDYDADIDEHAARVALDDAAGECESC